MRDMFEVYKQPVCKRCGHAWPIDPALTVPCPTCGAAAGANCPQPKRPSGHTVWGTWAHNARDLAAAAAHAYEHQPCTPPSKPDQTIQLPLFADC